MRTCSIVFNCPDVASERQRIKLPGTQSVVMFCADGGPEEAQAGTALIARTHSHGQKAKNARLHHAGADAMLIGAARGLHMYR